MLAPSHFTGVPLSSPSHGHARHPTCFQSSSSQGHTTQPSKFLKGRCDFQVTCPARKKCKSKHPQGSHVSGASDPGLGQKGHTAPREGGPDAISSCQHSQTVHLQRPSTGLGGCGHTEGRCLADASPAQELFCQHFQTGSPGRPHPSTHPFFTSKRPRPRCTNKPCESFQHP